MQELICQAIRERRLIEVSCKGYARQLEPYLVYESKNRAVVLHSWQVGGQWDKTPPPDWCNLRVDDIENVELLDSHYVEPHAGYNPFSGQFHLVLRQA